MSAMVMCPENAPSSAMFQRYPSPPVTYPFNNFAAYNNTGGQQDYNQFQMSDPSVQQAWYNAMYGARPEEWGYPTNTTNAMTATPPGIGQYAYRGGPMGIDYSQNPAGHVPSSSDSPGDTSSSSSTAGSPSNKQLRPPYDWMKKQTFQAAPVNGKTRTKDKYRVVYSDHQRLELEKEFHYSRYITIRRKAELAQALALSERQVKIWFQNRRAKERKQNKKRDETGKYMADEMGDLQEENKQHVQQHMNMHMPAHAQQQVTGNSPPTPPMHVQNQYSIHTPTHPGHGHHMSPPDGVSPHIVHQYSSVNQMQIPASPLNGHESVSPAHCSTSPVTIKSDIDAKDMMTS